jgi:hypothetical protein
MLHVRSIRSQILALLPHEGKLNTLDRVAGQQRSTVQSILTFCAIPFLSCSVILGAARRGELTRPVLGLVPDGQPVAPAPGSRGVT